MKFYHCVILFLFTMLTISIASATELSTNENDVSVEFVMAPPYMMKISFDEAVILDSMIIKDDDGYLLNLNAQIPKDENKVFAFDIPKLLPADYIILWQIHRDDIAPQQGQLKVAIQDDDSYPRPSTKKQKYGLLHKKLHY